MSCPNGKKRKIFYVSWYLFIANNSIFLTHIMHMRNVGNWRYAYECYTVELFSMYYAQSDEGLNSLFARRDIVFRICLYRHIKTLKMPRKTCI